MAGAYIDGDALRLRVTATAYVGIFDDDNDGAVDEDAVEQCIRDAEAYVNGYLRGIYTLPLASVPDQVRRIALDVAEAYAYQRNGTYARRDATALFERVRDELKDIRKGIIRLDVMGTPEPAANQVGGPRSGNPDAPDPLPAVFLNGTGDF